MARKLGTIQSYVEPKMISLVNATPQTRCIKCGEQLHIVRHGYASTTCRLEDTGKLTEISTVTDMEPDWFSARCTGCDATYPSSEYSHSALCHGSGYIQYDHAKETYNLIPGRKYFVDDEGRIEIQIKYQVVSMNLMRMAD